MNSTISRYSQLASATPMQYAEDLYVKLCKVADVYDELTANNIFIKRVDLSICVSLRNRKYSPTNLKVDLAYIAFKAQVQLAIQKESTNRRTLQIRTLMQNNTGSKAGPIKFLALWIQVQPNRQFNHLAPFELTTRAGYKCVDVLAHSS